ncbi:hypothetical protein C4564_03615 [Candidatus Microgenomates bacterium]|nr:MAG: hypothetical protein C4564_03615 [Candidatus Microgenomates bacterium]
MEQVQNLVVLAYAPTGLGHLRVTNALFEARPMGTHVAFLSSHERAASSLHRLTSIHPITRSFMEWTQNGWREEFFTRVYRHLLASRTQELHTQLEAILAQYPTPPKRLVFVSTHFSLAHQLSSLKKHLEKKTKVEASLVVVVTDDSPQKMWLVPEADLIVVPSEETKHALSVYARALGQGTPEIKANPYPINPRLSNKLNRSEALERAKQVDFNSKHRIRVLVPVSGAAVGLEFSANFTRGLRKLSKRFRFSVVSRQSVHTKVFLKKMSHRRGFYVHASENDRNVVRLYDEVLSKNVFAFELTKPSEQAFKALLAPAQKGGVVMLLTRPVGRQEYDNLAFLHRKGLIPSHEMHEKLRIAAIGNGRAPEDILKAAICWRGVRIPDAPMEAANFVYWCLREGIFAKMLECGSHNGKESAGAQKFWTLL